MTDKEKIVIVHSDDFMEVDSALSDAIAELEKSNARIVDLLAADTTEISEEVEELSSSDAGAASPTGESEKTSGDADTESGEA